MDENTSASSSVIQPADTSIPIQDPASTSTPMTGDGSASVVETEDTGDTSEIYTGPYEVVAEVVDLPDRPFFTTPFEEYTVTEGLLLLLVVLLVIRWIVDIVKGGFEWLLS